MAVNHVTLFDTEKVCAYFSEKDGVPFRYVCTTDLRASDVPCDIYFREEPHPQFGNRYLGLYYDNVRDATMITNADMVEELEFGMVKDELGGYHYSQSHHDYKELDNGNMIDGGRVYVRSSGDVTMFKVVDGEFIEVKDE